MNTQGSSPARGQLCIELRFLPLLSLSLHSPLILPEARAARPIRPHQQSLGRYNSLTRGSKPGSLSITDVTCEVGSLRVSVSKEKTRVGLCTVGAVTASLTVLRCHCTRLGPQDCDPSKDSSQDNLTKFPNWQSHWRSEVHKGSQRNQRNRD